MSVVPGSFGANLLARTSNLKALTIGQLRAEEKTLRLVVFNISKTLQKQLLRQGSPRKAQGNTANTRAQIALFQNRLTLVIREIQNRGQQQKLVGDIRDQPFTENGITTETSQFVLGSTIGSASASPLTVVNKNFFSISPGVYELKDNRVKGESIIILQGTGFEATNRPFLITDIFDSRGQNRFVHKVNNLFFSATQRDERIQIDERGNNLNEVFIRQFVTFISQPLGQVPENRVSNVFQRTLKSITGQPPKVQPPFLPPVPEPPPIRPPFPPEEPPIEEDTGRNLFQSAIIGVLALGAIGGSLLDKRRKR